MSPWTTARIVPEPIIGRLVGGRSVIGVLGFDWLRQNFLRKQVFISSSPEVDQYELSPEILNSAYESAFSRQKSPGFL